MKQSKQVKIDYMTHQQLKKIQKDMGFKRLGSVISWLLNTK